MNTDKLIALAKQFTKLQEERKNLDYRQAQWAREARGCFPDDKKFVTWCKSDLNLTDAAAQDLCLMARAVGIVPDVKTWIKLGGERQIRAVAELPAKAQVQVLEAAKATGGAIRTIAKDRFPTYFESPAYPPAANKAETKRMSDLEVLSRFIAENANRLPKLPSDVDVIVRMYVPNYSTSVAVRKRAA